MKKYSVIAAHPGTQHSYQTVLAAQKAGLLKCYYTSIYYKPEKFPFYIFGKLPFGLGHKIVNHLKRRYLSGLDTGKIVLRPLWEIFFLICSKVSPLKKYAVKAILRRNKRFGKAIAGKIHKGCCQAVICYDSAAFEIFEKARKENIVRILDQSIAHYRTGAGILKEEAKLHPEFADVLVPSPESLIDQLDKETALADYILAGSDFCKNTLIQNGVEPDKIKVVPYGFDPKIFFPQKERARTDKFRILFVGSIGQRKGIKYLLEAFRQLKLPKAELLLVGNIQGSGNGLLGYRDLFTHVSNVPHHMVHKYFQESDIFVFPTLLEGSVIVSYEALGCGLPVITTPNAGSVVRDGVDGYIVPIRDIDALKEKILTLYENPGLRAEMSANAAQRALDFTWDKYHERIGDFLKSIPDRTYAD